MTNNVWTDMVSKMGSGKVYQSLKDRKEVTINREEYEIFCKEFVFDKIKGETFAQAFCKRFNINDSAISILKSDGFAKELIESLGYIEK